MTKTTAKTHKLVVAAMLTAVAFVLQFIEFSIPIIPAFIKLDFSDLPALLGAFALGPIWGAAIELVKNIIHLTCGSSAGVGELANFLFGAAFTLVAGFLYQYKKNRKGAILGAVLGALAMAVIAIPVNYFIVYPAYVVVYGMPMEAIIGMYQAILPSADSLVKCLLIFNLPFTFCKGIIDAVFCFLIYKPLSPLLHK